MNISLPQLPWHGCRDLQVNFPDSWQIDVCHMAGHDREPLTSEQIQSAVTNPLGARPIREAARGKQQIAIVFDDMSRATRVYEIVPHIIDELEKAGIADDQIRFVPALGCHGPMTRPDFIKKLGKEIVKRFQIFNHNIFGNCAYVGTTSMGLKLYLNAEVARCDYKIAIGSIVPHGFAGYGGGGKIILPGIASFETTKAFHSFRQDAEGGSGIDFTGMGCIEGNPLSQNIQEAAQLLGLDFIADALLNTCGQTVALFAGSPQAAFDAGVAEAKSHYLTPEARDCDIVVTNTFAKSNEGEGGVITGFSALKAEGGDMVLICNAPDGHVSHYLLGNWGSLSNEDFRLRVNLPENLNQLIVYNEHPDPSILGFFNPQEKAVLVDSWDLVLDILQRNHGDRAKTAVYSSAEIQYCSNGG